MLWATKREDTIAADGNREGRNKGMSTRIPTYGTERSNIALDLPPGYGDNGNPGHGGTEKLASGEYVWMK